MKTKIYFFILLTLFSGALYSQETHELKIGVGDSSMLTSSNQIVNAFENFFSAILLMGTSEDDYKVKTPYLFADYRYPLSETVKIGLQVGFGSVENNKTSTYIDGSQLSKKFTYNYFTVMPGIDVRYFKKNLFTMYGNANLGVSFTTVKDSNNEKESTTGFSFQINPVGLSYGDKIAGFIEGGIGISFVNAGIKFGL